MDTAYGWIGAREHWFAREKIPQQWRSLVKCKVRPGPFDLTKQCPSCGKRITKVNVFVSKMGKHGL